MPHHSTYRRILSEVIVGEELEQIVAAYLSQLPRQGQEVAINVNGKSVRGTITREDPFGLRLLRKAFTLIGWLKEGVQYRLRRVDRIGGQCYIRFSTTIYRMEDWNV
jgi:hypothetical protein